MLSWEQPRTVLSLEMGRPETALSLLAGGEMRLMAGVRGEIPLVLSGEQPRVVLSPERDGLETAPSLLVGGRCG